MHYGKLLPDFIKNVILTRSSHLPLPLLLLSKKSASFSATAKTVAEEFDVAAYKTMTHDTHRNKCYSEWIGDAVKSRGNDSGKWLEIGPGADACLSLMLLKEHPTTHYYGIEVNRVGLQRAKLLLSKYPNASVVQGFMDDNYKKLPKEVNFILHEIFGTIASSEGVAKTIGIIREKYPGVISVPDSAGTFIVPLALKVDDIIKDPTLTLNNRVIRCKLPFSKCQLSIEHALLEWFDFNPSSAKSGKLTEEQKHSTKIKIIRDDSLTALGIYIVVKGNRDTLPVTTSNSDLPFASTNWTNICLPLLQPLNVKKSQTLQINTIVSDLNTLRPHYTLIILYNGKFVQEFNITYDDLYGEYRHLHTCHSLT